MGASQDCGSFYRVVPNVLSRAHSYTDVEVWVRSTIAQVRRLERSPCLYMRAGREPTRTTERVMAKIKKIALRLPNSNLRHCVSPSDFEK